MYDATEEMSAVRVSSATMCEPFVPLCYEAIIMIEKVEMKIILGRLDRMYSTISSYLTENSRFAVMRKTSWRR
jgi:hypothetical protein